MTRTVPVNLRLTEEEATKIGKKREDMQRMIGDPNGLTITFAQATRTMMFANKRRLTRLRDIPLHVLQADVAQMLHALGWDGGKIAEVLLGLGEAHKQARKEYADRLGIEVKDIYDN